MKMLLIKSFLVLIMVNCTASVGKVVVMSNGDQLVLTQQDEGDGKRSYALSRLSASGKSTTLWTSEVQDYRAPLGSAWHLMGVEATFEQNGEISLLMMEADGNALVFRFQLSADHVTPILLRSITSPAGSGLYPDKEGRISLKAIRERRPTRFKSHQEILLSSGHTVQFDRNGVITFHSGRVGNNAKVIGPEPAPDREQLHDDRFPSDGSTPITRGLPNGSE